MAAGYGTVLRPSVSASSSKQSHPTSSRKTTSPNRSNLFQFFNIPSNPETAAVRIIRNLSHFRFYYTLLLWLILFIALVPRRRRSLVFLLIITSAACLYLLLCRLLPGAARIIDRRLVLAGLLILAVVELVLTRAALHLLVSLAVGVPVIVLHAVLRITDDLFVNEEASAAGELLPLCFRKAESHLESQSTE